MTRSRAINFFPLIFFSLWAAVFSYPLIANMGESVVLAQGGDAWLHIWNLWWIDKSLVELFRNPYQTDFLYHPTGLNLYYHSLNLLNGVTSIPLQRLFGLTPAFNMLVLANLTLDGLAAYWLCIERTRSRSAALVGGALFASAPLLGTSLNLGQLDETTVWWIPLYVLSLWRALESPGPVWKRGGGRRATICAALCLIGASLATWYFTAGLAVFTAVWVPAMLFRGRGQEIESKSWTAWLRAAGKVGLVAVGTLLVLSPLLAAMIGERVRGETYMLPSATTTIANSADLAALFAPGRTQIPDWNRHFGNAALGSVAIGLSLIGLASRLRKHWPLGLALLTLVLLSLGPVLQIAGTNTGLPMPYALLNNVPFIGASRQPLRFLAAGGVCLALLSAFGVAYILERGLLAKYRQIVAPALLLLVAIELFGVPRALALTDPGDAYRYLQAEAEAGAVLEVPYDLWSARALLDQTVHERPIVGGYTSRRYPYPLSEGAPGISQLLKGDSEPLLGEDILTPPVSQTARASLDHYEVRYVVAHKGPLATGRYAPLEEVLAKLFTTGDVVFEDGETVVYKTSSLPPAEAERLPLVGLGTGWHRVEQNPVHRWTGSNVTDANANVWLGIPEGADGTYTLSMTAYSYNTPRTLTVTLNGNPLLSRQLDTGFSEIAVNLGELAVGDYQIGFSVAEPPESPPGDERKLGIGVTRLAIERSSP